LQKGIPKERQKKNEKKKLDFPEFVIHGTAKVMSPARQ
jgi:hypothetical protein